MPTKPKRPCRGRFNACPNLVEINQKYCPTCLPLEKKRQRKETREYDKTRDPNVVKWQKSARFQRSRAWFLKRNPICNECEKQNKLTPATILHHITPHNGEYRLFWDQSNWQGLCNACHEDKHVQDRWGRKQSITI